MANNENESDKIGVKLWRSYAVEYAEYNTTINTLYSLVMSWEYYPMLIGRWFFKVVIIFTIYSHNSPKYLIPEV